MKYQKKYRVQIEVELKAASEVSAKDVKEHLYLYPGKYGIYRGSTHLLTDACWGKFEVRMKEVK